MNVVYLSLLVYIVILIPCIISYTLCPADGIKGCRCDKGLGWLYCYSGYTGEDVPVFSKSNTTYDTVSYES